LLEERLVARIELQERGDDLRRVPAARDLLEELPIRNHVLQRSLQPLAEDLAAVRELRDARLHGAADEEGFQLPLVLDVGLGAPTLGAEQRRLRDEDVAAVDELRHLAIEERQQQRADV